MSNSFSLNRAKAIAKKEVFHIFRDPYTLAIALFMPIFMVMIYGFAINFQVQDVRLAVSDFDKSQDSRGLIETFGASNYFIPITANDPKEVLDLIESEKTRAGLIIPPQFSKNLGNGRNAKVQIFLDGADNSSVGPIASYMGGVQTKAIERLTLLNIEFPYKLKSRYLFNPELDSRWFIIPGLIAVVMAVLSLLLTSLTVAREWENGSMELLLSTPIKPIEIILGKLVPYAILGIFSLLTIFIIAEYVFHVPFRGNPILFGISYSIFLITFLAQGLLISILTKKQEIATQFAVLTGFLPSQLLSGFIFPIASMPLFFQDLTMIFPARWFVQLSRNIYLKDSKFLDLLFPFTMLLLICVAVVFIATSKFKRSLEK